MPAGSTRIFVALRPCEELAAFVWRHKRRLLAAAGPQLYASDPPHATVYLANFAASRVAEVAGAVELVAAAMEMPAATIDGWQVFESDPLTGLHTLACRFDGGACDRLRELQLRVLAAVAPLHDAAATHESLLPRWGALSDEQRRRALLFGFPYVGGGWIPHLTIASVRPEQWPHVGQVFNLSQPTSGPVENLSYGTFTHLDVFELQGLEPRRLATFPLAPQHLGKAA
jgi:2'-5' RNA ligase